jgi:hypothetical protein
VLQHDHPRRRRDAAGADGQDAAHPELGHLPLVEHAHAEPDLLRELLGRRARASRG